MSDLRMPGSFPSYSTNIQQGGEETPPVQRSEASHASSSGTTSTHFQHLSRLSRGREGQRATSAPANDEQVYVKSEKGLDSRPLTQVRDSRHYRWTGETAWQSSHLPAAFNRQVRVFEPTPPALNYDAIEPTAKDVHINGSLSVEDINDLGTRSLEKLEMSNVRFPGEWDSRSLANSQELRYLNINGGNNFTLTDHMYGLSRLPALATLNLHRAEFMNNNSGESYRSLATMRQLQHLSLDRTITLEKSPGEALMKSLPDGRSIRQVTNLAPIVVDSLLQLIDHGSLKSLSLRWCTALSPNDLQRLQAAAYQKGCSLTLP